ncbi:MAG: long-chain-fatty-acid--CoA ligase [Bacilli bacterium]|nr:long-chain-fatty-acid--CoA ligase [Bacilli bacterium]
MTMDRPWYKHYPEDIPRTIEYDKKPLYQFLQETAERVPDKKALNFMGKEMTFREILTEAKKLANYLQKLGLKKGDRVASMLPNTPQAVVTYYGTLMAGGIVVQVNPLYTERELAYQMKDSGAKFIVCLDILLPRVSKVKEETDLEHIIVTRIADYLPFPKNLIYPFIQKREYNIVVKVEETDDTHVWKNVIANSPAEYQEVEIDPEEDLALLQYTGGTTGLPKGVMLTHYNLVANVQMAKAWISKAERDKEVVLGVLPFFHVYGMTTVMNLSIMYGAKMILLPRFDAGQVLKTIQKHKPTLFPGAPTIYIGLLNHPDFEKYDLSSIKACISGSASLPLEVQEQFEKRTNGKIVEGYGLTESSPVTHANPIWGRRVNGSIGIPWPDTDAKIVKNGTLEEVPVGEIGEIAVKGPQVMKGYWNNPEATEEVLKDGWLLTGDMGKMDEDGYFYVVDRKKDVIIAGGFNIYPREIEEVLFEHPDIVEAAVIGVPDDYRGETVKAVIVPKPGAKLDEKQLDEYCRKHLAAFKVPRIYEFREELPKSVIGKVLKRQLVEEAIEQMKKEATS